MQQERERGRAGQRYMDRYNTHTRYTAIHRFTVVQQYIDTHTRTHTVAVDKMAARLSHKSCTAVGDKSTRVRVK